MEIALFLLQLAFVLFAAKVFGEIASYFRISPVLGELIAGIVIGPSLLACVSMTPMMEVLSEIAILLLLFEVGIQTDVGRLFSSGGKAFFVAIGGIVMPFIFGFCSSYLLFSFSLLTSLFIGSTLTATSIGITLRVLRDMKKQHTKEAQVVLGAAIFDDIIGIILLSILYEFAFTKEVDLFGTGKVLILISVFSLASPFLVKGIAHLLQKWQKDKIVPGFIPSTITALILLFGFLAHALGAPLLLGGFVVGIALSEKFSLFSFLPKNKEFARKVEAEMAPLVHMFTPIFFVGIGLSLDLSSVNFSSSAIWLLTGVLTVGAFIGKLLSGFCLLKESFSKKWIVGLSMMPRGEVGFIFASVGLSAGVFSSEVYMALVLVIMITTLLSPPTLRFFYNHFEESSGKKMIDYFLRK